MANFGEDEIGVGGDTSVRWNVDVRNARPRTVRSDQEGTVVHQEGIAETPDGKAYTIAIKLPKDEKARARFPAERSSVSTTPSDSLSISRRTSPVMMSALIGFSVVVP